MDSCNQLWNSTSCRYYGCGDEGKLYWTTCSCRHTRTPDHPLVPLNGRLKSVSRQIPFLINTSSSPSILLLSSVGAVIPAPTRTLYGSTKAASLLLYQALSIEHPSISFTFVLPGTIEGNFRASAVDGGPIRENEPNQSGLKTE